jgi:hypothetical protein
MGLPEQISQSDFIQNRKYSQIFIARKTELIQSFLMTH